MTPHPVRPCHVSIYLPSDATIEGIAAVPWIDGEGPILPVDGAVTIECPALGEHAHAIVRQWVAIVAVPMGDDLVPDRIIPVLTNA